MHLKGGAFPPIQRIAPPPPIAPQRAGAVRQKVGDPDVGAVVPPGLRDCRRAKLAAMMRQVEQLSTPWHTHVEALLERA